MTRSAITVGRVDFIFLATVREVMVETLEGFGTSMFHDDVPSNKSTRRFPKARVWPAIADSASSASAKIQFSVDNGFPNECDLLTLMPDISTQQQLLDVFFTSVHPCFPVLLKHRFLEDWRIRFAKDPSTDSSLPDSSLSVSRLARPPIRMAHLAQIPRGKALFHLFCFSLSSPSLRAIEHALLHVLPLQLVHSQLIHVLRCGRLATITLK